MDRGDRRSSGTGWRNSFGGRLSLVPPARVRMSGGSVQRRTTMVRGVLSSTKKNPGGRPSSLANALASSSRDGHPNRNPTILKDTRPLSDPRYKSRMVAELIAFLQENGYHPTFAGRKNWIPTQKEFASIFKFIYGFLSPSYKCDKKIEEEFVTVLKQLGYPFNLNKGTIQSLGSLHSWPTVLGALTWLRQLVQYYLSCDMMKTCLDLSDRERELLFGYSVKAYNFYLKVRDEEAEAENIKFVKELYQQDACDDEETLQQEIAQLSDEVELLERDMVPMDNAQENLEVLLKDKVDITTYIKQQENQLAAIQAQLQERNKVLEQEGFEVLDVSLPTSEERLQKIQMRYVQLQQDLDKASSLAYQSEMNMAKARGRIEKTCSEYNAEAQPLLFEYYRDKKMAEEYVVSASTSLHHIRNKITPNLQKLRGNYKEKLRELTLETFELQKNFDRLQEQITNKTEVREELKSKIKKFQMELENRKKEYNLKHQQLVSELEQSEKKLQECSELRFASVEKQMKARDDDRRRLEQDRKQWKKDREKLSTHIQTMSCKMLEHKVFLDKTLASHAAKAEQYYAEMSQKLSDATGKPIE